MIIKNAISVGINILNGVLEDSIINLLEKVRYRYYSTIISHVVIVVFICEFINTAIIGTIASANLNNTPLSWMGGMVNNLYSDFTS